jgi:uncharacterized secreted protein with C-terminal beta-propeller domain
MSMKSKNCVPGWLLLLSLLISGCSGGSNTSEPAPSSTPSTAAHLTRFSSCDALASHIDKTLAQQSALQSRRDNFWILETSSDAMAPALGGAAPPDATPDHYTTTNNQEVGVDEPDFVKTDGQHLYMLRGNSLLVFQAWPAEQTREIAHIELNNSPFALFLHNDLVVVLAWNNNFNYPALATDFMPSYQGSLQLSLYDVTTRTSPVLTRRIDLEGTYVDARLIDGQMHLVLSSGGWARAYSTGGALPPIMFETGVDSGTSSPSSSPPAADATTSSVLEIFPAYLDTRYDSNGATSSSEPLCACENVYYPEIPNGTGLITLYSLDLNNPGSAARSVSVLSDSGTVYASTSTLYLATTNSNNWLWWGVENGDNTPPRATTVLHRFGLGDNPDYQGSGEVPGWVLNRFSLGEYQDSLRIATTEPAWVTGSSPANRLLTLKLEQGELVEQGRVEGLGKPGESIFAVRLVGERGYVVTFEQVDPLYVLDLADPAHPAKAGELEVPGFSTYLHPLTEDRLLALGRDPAQNAMKLSLFDVSDADNPREVATLTEDAQSYSSAEYEPHAFTYDPHTGTLALPLTAWSYTAPDVWGGYQLTDGLQLYAIDPSGGISRRGFIDHSSFYRDDLHNRWYQPQSVERSLFASAAGGSYLYSISARGLMVNNLENLEPPVATSDLPSKNIYWDYPDDVLAVPQR